jgi:hypothetical protein
MQGEPLAHSIIFGASSFKYESHVNSASLEKVLAEHQNGQRGMMFNPGETLIASPYG